MKARTPKFLSCLLAAAALWSAALPPALALDADGTKTVLRGAGTRTLGVQALYTAKLYGAGPGNQIDVVMARDVKAQEIATLLARGLVANASEEELSRLIPELFGLGEVIGAQHALSAGDGFSIIANADRSTTIRIHRRTASQPVEVRFEQPELFGVMLKIWLGPQPADGALKQALLGQAV